LLMRRSQCLCGSSHGMVQGAKQNGTRYSREKTLRLSS
jgi:hypothetical protein